MSPRFQRGDISFMSPELWKKSCLTAFTASVYIIVSFQIDHEAYIMAPTSHCSTLVQCKCLWAMEFFSRNDRSSDVSRLNILEPIKTKLGTIYYHPI